MMRKLSIVLAVVLLGAAFILPAGAFFSTWGVGPCGWETCGPFGTSFTTGFTTASTVTSGFSTVDGVAVPFCGGPACGFGGPFCGFGGPACGFGNACGFGGPFCGF